YVKKVAIYRGTSNLVNEEATASGWGAVSDNSGLSNVLRHVTNNIISNEECKMFYLDLRVIDSTVCLSGSGDKTPCSGDSGAPLHIVENNKLFQAGIGSFGRGTTCGGGFPSGYSRVSSFAKWIDDNKKP
ncbi:hypothetical protein ILUMI_16497, partial [Ignelater luminosus]